MSQLLILPACDRSSSRFQALLSILCCLVCSGSGNIHAWGEEIIEMSKHTKGKVSSLPAVRLWPSSSPPAETSPQPHRQGRPVSLVPGASRLMRAMTQHRADSCSTCVLLAQNISLMTDNEKRSATQKELFSWHRNHTRSQSIFRKLIWWA